jgi:hypothetical protein
VLPKAIHSHRQCGHSRVIRISLKLDYTYAFFLLCSLVEAAPDAEASLPCPEGVPLVMAVGVVAAVAESPGSKQGGGPHRARKLRQGSARMAGYPSYPCL